MNISIEFIDENEEIIESLSDIVTNPFREGDIIYLNVSVNDKKFWHNKEEFIKKFKVKEIKNFISINYAPFRGPDKESCFERIAFSIQLEEIKE